MGYYLKDHPHPTTPQFTFPRRGGGAPNGVCVVHTTESAMSFLGPDAGAENVAHWIATQRPGYGSYHAIADSDSIVDMAHVMWETWHDASSNPNTFGIAAAVQAHRWLEIEPIRRRRIYENLAEAAAMKARESIEYGRPYPDPIHITAAQARAGKHGFVGHGEMMPETRTDPGKDFDWNLFLSIYSLKMGFTKPAPKPAPQEDEMTDEQFKALVAAIKEEGVETRKMLYQDYYLGRGANRKKYPSVITLLNEIKAKIGL